MRILYFLLAMIVVLVLSRPAMAVPNSFTEDFSNAASLPGPFLEQSAGGSPATFDGAVAKFPDLTPSWPPPGRSYLRTIDDDYNSVNFVAEITVTIFNGRFFDNGDGIVFFGIGIGEPNPSTFFEPGIIPNIYMQAAPDNWHSGNVNILDNNLAAATSPNATGTGTHRLQMSWDATLQEMTLAIHKDFTGGPFVASSTFGPFNGSDNGFNASNSRIFFGGTSGTIFDDLSVQISLPEPIGFSTFNITEAKVKFKDNPNDDEFEIKGKFVLGEGNDGINPINEDVTVNVGTSSIVIPASVIPEPSSFVEEKAGVFKYKGIINATHVEMKIKTEDYVTYNFKVKVKGTDLTDTCNPVDVGLTIGDDAGTANVRLKGVLMSEKKQ